MSTFSDLADELQRITNEKLTGNIFIASSDNRSARMSFEDGNLVSLLCQGIKGDPALNLITQMPQIRFRFQKGAIPSTQSTTIISSTKDIIGILKSVEALSMPGKQEIKTAKIQNEKGVKNHPSEQGISQEQKIIIQEVLAECIGPMATILCEDTFDSINTLEGALDSLASEIPSDLAVRFRLKARQRLS